MAYSNNHLLNVQVPRVTQQDHLHVFPDRFHGITIIFNLGFLPHLFAITSVVQSSPTNDKLVCVRATTVLLLWV